MTDLRKKYQFVKAQECAFRDVCYISNAMDCFGYKMDCPLYKQSNGEYLSIEEFHNTVDQLINKTKAKYMGIL